MSAHLLYLMIAVPVAIVIEVTEISLRKRARVLIVAALLSAAMIPIGMIWARRVPPPGYLAADFMVAYYPAGQNILDRPERLYASEPPVSGYVNVPVMAYLFAPFARMYPTTAAGIFTAISLIVLIAIITTLPWVGGVSGSTRALLRALTVLNGPLLYNVTLGNTTSISLLLLMAAISCFGARREFRAGALIALAALVKLPLMLLGVWLLLRRRVRAFAGLLLICAAVGLLSLAVCGSKLNLQWYQRCIRESGSRSIANFNLQSIEGWFARLATSDQPKDWSGIKLPTSYAVAKTIVVLIVAAFTALILWKSGPIRTIEQANSEFSIVLCLALVISPITWSHYYCLLLLPIALALGRKLELPRSAPVSAILGIAVILISAPVIRPRHWMITSEWREMIFLSLQLYGGLILLSMLLYGRAVRATKGVPHSGQRSRLARKS